MKHVQQPILLGEDWFMKTTAAIYPNGDCLIFPRKSINLECSDLVDTVTRNSISEQSEGRPTKLMEATEDMYESFGIESDKINKVVVKTHTPQTGEDKLFSETEVKPAIEDRCSKGTHDIGRFTRESMHIELSSKIPVYRRSKSEQEELEEENEKFLKNDRVEESISPYNNPVMTVKKKNGKKRIVNDFRGINEIMTPVQFPISLIKTIIGALAEGKYFSVLDMTSGFWQCPLDEESRK